MAIKIIKSGFDETNMPSGPHKAPRIWILVADSQHIRLLKKDGHHLKLLEEQKLHSDHSGKGELKLAHDIADRLDASAHAHAYDRLILAAPPHMLGDLRKILSHTVQARIAAEIDKDLTKMNDAVLHEELKKIVWF
jgi:protein required for attachment to host cells